MFFSLSYCSGVSHSVTSDMHIIQQETPLAAKTTKGRRFTEDEDDEGCFSSRSDAVDSSYSALVLYNNFTTMVL